MQDVLRNERKFLISEAEMLQKCCMLRQVIHEDEHNGVHGYTVRSLYFDTEYDSDLFDKELGVDVRKKMRLRIYHTDDPCALLEMKQKQGEQQRKRSLKMKRDDAEALINGQYDVLLSYDEPFAGECYSLMRTRLYRPRVIVEYRRIAFIAKENRIRITFDHRIEATASSFELFDERLNMTPVLDPGATVLEVKYNGFLLDYFRSLLNSVDRSKLSVSKYCLARGLSYFSNL